MVAKGEWCYATELKVIDLIHGGTTAFFNGGEKC